MLDLLLCLLIGISLSSACGFRVFLPVLICSIAARFDILSLPSNMGWASSNLAIIVLSVATVLEIAAYYIPVVDNALDFISVPVSSIAGILVMFSFFNVDNDILRWATAAVLGGGSAGIFSASISIIRIFITTLLAGLGNWIVSTLEWIFALVLSILAIFAPIISIFLLIVLLLIILKTRKKIHLSKTAS
jgi:hypothetical protein